MALAPGVITPAWATASDIVLSFEEEFIAGLIDIFYSHLEKSLFLVLRGSTISFNTLTFMLDRTIENMWEVGGPERVYPLEQLVQNFRMTQLNCTVFARPVLIH